MKVRNAGFREQFRKKDLSKLAFRKVRGYKFGKVDKEHEGCGWALIKDDTSSRIRRLIYTDTKQLVYYPKPLEIKNILDLEAVLPELRAMWEDPNIPKKTAKFRPHKRPRKVSTWVPKCKREENNDDKED